MDEFDPIDEPRINRSWLVVLGDLFCLMLTFFVMMSAMQKVDSARWAGVAKSLSRSLDPSNSVWSLRPRAERNAGLIAMRPASDLAYLERVLATRMQGNDAFAGVTLGPVDDRLAIALPDAPSAQTVAALADLLGNFGNAIVVRAFGADGRVAAMERAQKLAVALGDAGYPRDVPALGLAGPRRMEIVVREGRAAP